MTNKCRNECDIINNDGCNNGTEICSNGVLEENGNFFNYTYCNCTIPSSQLADEESCQYKQTNCNDGTSLDCYGNGKCVRLPDQTEESCFCKITNAGKYCQNQRTCRSANEFDSQRLCLNYGTCEETENEPYYKCKCETGFYGTNCENLHPCHPFKVKVFLFSHIHGCFLTLFSRITVRRVKFASNSKIKNIIA